MIYIYLTDGLLILGITENRGR